ncbi:hypothetical protein GOD93_11115 [Sinorhizobium medicae]|nr:hypothetical protein [Sinorhizobium medicae]
MDFEDDQPTLESMLPILADPEEYVRAVFHNMRAASKLHPNVCVRVRRKRLKSNPHYIVERWEGTPKSKAMWTVAEYDGRTHKPLPKPIDSAEWGDIETELEQVKNLLGRIRGIL